VLAPRSAALSAEFSREPATEVWMPSRKNDIVTEQTQRDRPGGYEGYGEPCIRPSPRRKMCV
jgi:hypothetical protein